MSDCRRESIRCLMSVLRQVEASICSIGICGIWVLEGGDEARTNHLAAQQRSISTRTQSQQRTTASTTAGLEADLSGDQHVQACTEGESCLWRTQKTVTGYRT